MCLLGKFLNRSSVRTVQLVLVLTSQREHLIFPTASRSVGKPPLFTLVQKGKGHGD